MKLIRKKSVSYDVSLIFVLLLPIFAEQFASVFLSVLSSMLSSNIDPNILNVTTLVSSVTGLPGAFYGCVASGTAILMSHSMGASDTEKSRSLFKTSMHLGISIALFIAVLLLVFGNPLLRVTYPNMSENFFKLSTPYLIFSVLSFPIAFYQTNCIGIMRSCLNTKAAFLISMSVALVDLLFKALFMLVFDLGIWGLCIAMAVSKVYSLIVCTVIVKKIGIFDGCMSDFKHFVDFGSVKEIFRIGVVMCIEAFLLEAGGVVIAKILADMGDLETYVFSVVSSMRSLITTLPNSIALVVQILAGRYHGAGENVKSLKLSMKLTLITTSVFMLLSLGFAITADKFTLLYTRDAQSIAPVIKTFRVYLFTIPLVWSFGNVLSAGIRGYGNVRMPMLTLVITMWVFRIPATYYAISVLKTGAVGRIFVESLETAIYGIAFLIYYFLEMHRLKKSEASSEESTAS